MLGVAFLGHLIVCLAICGRQGLFLFFKPVSHFKPMGILEEWKSAVKERERGGTLSIRFIFVSIAYGGRLPCLSTYMDFWHLTSSPGQRCNQRKRTQGWLAGLLGKAGVYADHSGLLPNTALSFRLSTVHISACSLAHCEALSTDPVCTFGLQSHW